MTAKTPEPATPDTPVFDSIADAIRKTPEGLRLYHVNDPRAPLSSFVWAKSPEGALAIVADRWGVTATRVTDKEQLDAARNALQAG